MFCLSFLSIDRATAPGQYEQSYLNIETLTKYVPHPQKLISMTQSDQTRSGNTILYLNLCTARDGRGCLPIHTSMPCVPQKGYSSSLGDTHPSLKLPSFYVCRTSTGQLLWLPQISLKSIRLPFLCLSNLHRSAPWIFTHILRIQLSSFLSQLLTTLLKWTTSMVSRHSFEE